MNILYFYTYKILILQIHYVKYAICNDVFFLAFSRYKLFEKLSVKSSSAIYSILNERFFAKYKVA